MTGAPHAGQVLPAIAPDLSRLSLADAKALWLARSREIKLARRAVEGADADRVSAGQRPNPQFSINSSSIAPRGGVGSGGVWDKQIDTVFRLDQLIERGGKRELRVRTAEARLAAARGDLEDTLRSQRMVLDQAYYDLLLAQEKRRIAEENAALFKKTVEAAERRLRAGDLSPSDVARIKVEALRSENDARQAAGDLERAQVALAYLIGAEREAKSLHASDPWPAVASFSMGEVNLENRADVRAAAARVSAAESARDLAYSLRSRDVTVGVQFEHNPAAGGLSPPANTVGFGASFPLFLAYQYEGEIRRAEADLQAARDALERVRALAASDVAAAASAVETAAERARRFEGGLLAEAGRAARAAEFAFSRGALGVIDLLDTRRTLKATQLEAIAARADYAKALAAWRAATAGEEESP